MVKMGGFFIQRGPAAERVDVRQAKLVSTTLIVDTNALGGGELTHVMNGRSRTTIDPRTATIPGLGRST